METPISINLITTNPKVRGGRPCIVGTNLRISDVVVAHLFHDQTADEISAGYVIPISAVYAALSYYFEHKSEIDADIRQQIDTAHKLKEDWIADGGSPLLP